MILTTLQAKTLDEIWHRLIFTLIEEGSKHNLIYTVDQGSYEGQKRLEFESIMFNIEYPGHSPRLPMINRQLGIPPPVDEEYASKYAVDYILTGRSLKNEQYTYGTRLNENIWKPDDPYYRKSDGCETVSNVLTGCYSTPIKEVISMFRDAAPNYRTNQACVEISKPSDVVLCDPPCCRLCDMKIKDSRLHFYLYFRSWDLYCGLPANLYGFQMLKEMMAQEIGVGDGEIVCYSKGLHLYDHFWEMAKILARKDPKEFKFMGE